MGNAQQKIDKKQSDQIDKIFNIKNKLASDFSYIKNNIDKSINDGVIPFANDVNKTSYEIVPLANNSYASNITDVGNVINSNTYLPGTPYTLYGLQDRMNTFDSFIESGPYATKSSLDSFVGSGTYATKSSLGNYATKSSLDDYVTKSSMDNYATTSILNNYATTSSLDNYASKSNDTDLKLNDFISQTGTLYKNIKMSNMVTGADPSTYPLNCKVDFTHKLTNGIMNIRGRMYLESPSGRCNTPGPSVSPLPVGSYGLYNFQNTTGGIFIDDNDININLTPIIDIPECFTRYHSFDTKYCPNINRNANPPTVCPDYSSGIAPVTYLINIESGNLFTIMLSGLPAIIQFTISGPWKKFNS